MPLPRNPLTLTDADLGRMSDGDLAVLEDQLLLYAELDTSKGARFTAGRLVVYALSAVGIVVLLGFLSRFPTARLGPISILLYLGAIFGGILVAHRLWSAAGRPVRTGVRWLLGHWPVILYLGAQLYRLTHRG